MKALEAQSLAYKILEAAGIPDAQRESRLLVSHLLDCPISAIPVTDQDLDSEKQRRLEAALRQRKELIPLQYILGETEFMSLSFKVDASVLIPRGDTERIVEAAVSLLKDEKAPLVADICCGCGNIAVSLAYYLPRARVLAVDIAPEALELARQNAQAHQVASRIDFLCGDLLAPLKAKNCRPDMIVSNPPYIKSGELDSLQAEVQKEPRLALDGGPDGLAYYRRLAKDANGLLLPRGYLFLETGCDQKDSVIEILRQNRYTVTATINDYGGNHRGLVAQK